MLEQLARQPENGPSVLIAKFATDPRENKIDLGAGVLRTDGGNTDRSIPVDFPMVCCGV